MKRTASQAGLVTVQTYKRQKKQRAPKVKKDELKYTVYLLGVTGIDYNGLRTSLFGNLSRGDTGKNNYDGNGVVPTSISLRYSMVPQNATDMLRVIVAQQIKGALPTAAQLLDTVGNIGTPLSSYNRPYKATVKILSDKLYRLSNNEFGNYTDEIYIKGKNLRPLEVLSSAQTTVSGDIALYVYSQISAAGPTFNFCSEITYVD